MSSLVFLLVKFDIDYSTDCDCCFGDDEVGDVRVWIELP